MTNPQSPSGLTGLGKLFSVLMVLGLLALGGYIVMKRFTPAGGQNGVVKNDGTKTNDAKTSDGKIDAADLAETKTSVERLPPAAAYVPAKPDTLDIELSEYAGYSGLIAANGGLAPNPDSIFSKKYGFKLNITISENESWPALNSGKMAASATTADVLAVYGRQFGVTVPAQIGYSRGADALVVRSDIKNVNQLKGKIILASQFTEADFFIRYLAQEAGIGINMLADPAAAPAMDKVNLIFCDSEKIPAVILKDIKSGTNAIAGAVTWAPFTNQIVDGSGGKAKILVSNKNLLVVADVLIVNAGFAQKNPDKVAGLVDGLLAGNKAVRENPEAGADLIGKAFKWDHAKTLAELQKVHLSNLPEQLAFFNGTMTQGGSFAGIYQSAVLAYGPDLIPNPIDSDHFVMLSALKAADAAGAYKDQVPAITPLSSGAAAPAEVDPVLSKDIRFLFEPNSSKLDMSDRSNLTNLGAIKKILDVAPGSHIILVGHVDNSRIPELRRTGGEELVQKTALEAMQLSKDRANEIMKQLVSHEKAEAKRLEVVGRGWAQPVSTTNPDLNRRVEVQWFTLE